jgi:hypothetical protein
VTVLVGGGGTVVASSGAVEGVVAGAGVVAVDMATVGASVVLMADELGDVVDEGVWPVRPVFSNMESSKK